LECGVEGTDFEGGNYGPNQVQSHHSTAENGVNYKGLHCGKI